MVLRPKISSLYKDALPQIAGQFTERLQQLLGYFDCGGLSSLSKGPLVQSEKRRIIADFQHCLCHYLSDRIKIATWQPEKVLHNTQRDACDITGVFQGEHQAFHILIELDTIRADQVAKKFVSRLALTIGQPVIYIAICYPGTDQMNRQECIKYFQYCADIINALSKKGAEKAFIGYMVE